MGAPKVKVHRRKPHSKPKTPKLEAIMPPVASAGAPVSAAAAPAPTAVRTAARSLTSRMRPATSRPVASARGAFRADPVIAGRSLRGTYLLRAPSVGSFCHYITDGADLAELSTVGLATMMRERRALRCAIIVVLGAAALAAALFVAYFCLTPATADADSPYLTAEVGEAKSTSSALWKAGTIPSLYQADPAWADMPYGQATLGEAGAAPCALAMAYVAVTGNTDRAPVDFAQWAIDHDLTASGADTVDAYLTSAAPDFGLALAPIKAEGRALRHAIVSNTPVLVVTRPGTFAPTAIVVVLDDIDRDSHIVLHDPTSPTRSGKGWLFTDIVGAAEKVFEVRAA